jgi:hypothetical protein
MLTEIKTTNSINVMKRSELVVRLTRSTERVKEVTVHSGDLTRISKSSDGELAKRYGMWKPEFEDHLFSGKYAIELIPYTESYFKQAEDNEHLVKYPALGGVGLRRLGWRGTSRWIQFPRPPSLGVGWN